MKLVAPDLLKLGLIDDVIPEPVGGAHHDHTKTADSFRDVLSKHLDHLCSLKTKQLLNERYEKFRRFGEWNEA
jgi:acetyl-CoA carboxylase carboxyl transferase subunit alpha